VLWDRFSPLVRRILRRALGPQAEVEGLLQDVFLRVLSQLSRIAGAEPKLGGLPEAAQLRPFVVGVTVRVLSTELRRHRLRRLLRLRSPWQQQEFPAGPADATTRTALLALYQILDDLDVDARLTFTLRHFEGLQITELASVMDASLSTAKRRLARANARVQAAVSRHPALTAYATAASLGDAP
jgi:RNA polymerase sigma-70 factor (ECF subfamily)